MKATVRYLLSEAGRKKSLLSGGDGCQLQVLQVEVAPELLELAVVSEDGEVSLDVGFTGWREPVPVDLRVAKADRPWLEEVLERKEFDAPQDLAALIEWEKSRRERLRLRREGLRPALLAAQEEYDRKAAETDSRREEEHRRAAADQAARAFEAERERVRWEEEKRRWADVYGSEYLKRALTLGYACNKRYVAERAALELPGFKVVGGNASWEVCSCPEESFLEELSAVLDRGFHARVVVFFDPGVDNYGRMVEPFPAILVEEYLGKYTLVKALG